MREPEPGESRLELRVPVRPVVGGYVYFCGIFPVNGEEWQRMIDVLDAMRPALVRERAETEELPR